MPVFKEKLRLRGYGTLTNQDEVYLELKKKYDGVVYKRRVGLPLLEAEAFLRGELSLQGQGQIGSEIDYFVRKHRPRPRLLLAYDRVALVGVDDPHLRITFDHNIRWRDHDLRLSHGSDGLPLLSDAMVLMEVKAYGAMPLWLTRLLSENRIYPCPFSKYGTWYREHMMGKGQAHYA